MNINKYNIQYYLVKEKIGKSEEKKNKIKRIPRPKSASDININDSNLKYFNFKNKKLIKSSKTLFQHRNYFKKKSDSSIKKLSKDSLSITSENISRNTSRLNSLLSKKEKKKDFFSNFFKYKLLDKTNKQKNLFRHQLSINNLIVHKTKDKLDNIFKSDDLNTDDKTLTPLTLISPRCNNSHIKGRNLNRFHSNLSNESLSLISYNKSNFDDLSNDEKNILSKTFKFSSNTLNEKSLGDNNNNKINKINKSFFKRNYKTFHTTKFVPRDSKGIILNILFQRKQTILNSKFSKQINDEINNLNFIKTENQKKFISKLEEDVKINSELSDIIYKKNKKNDLFLNNFEYDFFENLNTIEKIKINERIKELFEDKGLFSKNLSDNYHYFQKINNKYSNKFDKKFFKKYINKRISYLIRFNFYLNSTTTLFLFESSLDIREEEIFYLLKHEDLQKNNKHKLNRLRSKIYFMNKFTSNFKERKMIKSKTMNYIKHKMKIKEKNKIEQLLYIANKKSKNFLFIKELTTRDTLYQESLGDEDIESKMQNIKEKIIFELNKEKIKREKQLKLLNKNRYFSIDEDDEEESEMPSKIKVKRKEEKFLNNLRSSSNNFTYNYEKYRNKNNNNVIKSDNKLLNYDIKKKNNIHLTTREILEDNIINFYSQHPKNRIKIKKSKKNLKTIKMSSYSVQNLFSSRNKLVTLLKTNQIKAKILENIGDNIYKIIFFHIKETNEKEIKKLIKDNIDFINMNYQDEFGDTFLLKAVKYNCSFDIIQFLITQGSNPNVWNKEGNSPLHFSLSHGNYKITNLLLLYDADETHRNNDGLIPWQCINKTLKTDIN